MKIEFYIKKNGKIINEDKDYFFIMDNVVYSNNGYECESQERTVTFTDFIKKRPDLG